MGIVTKSSRIYLKRLFLRILHFAANACNRKNVCKCLKISYLQQYREIYIFLHIFGDLCHFPHFPTETRKSGKKNGCKRKLAPTPVFFFSSPKITFFFVSRYL